MPYATNGRISREPIDGGIEISEQQYRDALDGSLAGKQVTINGGFRVDFSVRAGTEAGARADASREAGESQ